MLVWQEIPLRDTQFGSVVKVFFVWFFFRFGVFEPFPAAVGVRLEFELTELVAREPTSEMKMRIKRDSPCLVLRFMPLGKSNQKK